ncbi:MAG: AAA family ATPase [Proteobacteria bacterium]|nr:AAA family ATPase [Pseudomonadota bacterium]
MLICLYRICTNFCYQKIQKEDEVYVFFDEIQYLKNWEVHLKNLVDVHRQVKFVASGSAAALRRKSQESGAGRFTDFILPPLTFAEYLRLKLEAAFLIVQVRE